jgi:Tol biopolymer transport system component
MRKIYFIFFLGLLFLTSLLHAQVSTDLWVVDIEGKGGQLKFLSNTAKPLTNRPEYDNQPNFINDSELIFSAADEKGNHDLILYSFRTGRFTNLTQTPDRSEYSPSLTECGSYFSAIVVEPDGTQRLWLYPVTGEAPELLYEDIFPVGYYDWYEGKAALFVLGEPNSLVYVRGKGSVDTLDTDIGRTIRKRPNTSEISYLNRKISIETDQGKSFRIASVNLKTGAKKDYGFAVPGSQDFIWIDKNHLLMAKGNEVFTKHIQEKNWQSLGKIESSSHQGITRMAYNPDLNKLILVLNRNQTQKNEP